MACPGKSGGFQYCPDAVLDKNSSVVFCVFQLLFQERVFLLTMLFALPLHQSHSNVMENNL